MAEDRAYDVFLSYSMKDRGWVSEFAGALGSAGVRAWFDAFELSPGERWQERIEEALRSSKTLVVILSPNRMDSPWTFFELGAALADRKQIIPVVTEDVPFEAIPMVLRQFQFLKGESPKEAGKRVAGLIGQAAGACPPSRPGGTGDLTRANQSG